MGGSCPRISTLDKADAGGVYIELIKDIKDQGI